MLGLGGEGDTAVIEALWSGSGGVDNWVGAGRSMG